MERLDLAIVGGGPAGLTLALRLQGSSAPLRFAVFERARYPRFKVCAGGLAGNVRPVLREIGVDVPRPRVTIRGSRMKRGSRSVDFDEPDFGWVVRRDVFDGHLASEALRRGVDLRAGRDVQEVRPVVGGFEIRSGTEVIGCRALALCTGLSGRFHRQLGIPEATRPNRLVMVEGPRTTADPDDRVVFDLTDLGRGLAGYVWHFPYVDADGRPGTNRGLLESRLPSSTTLARKSSRRILERHLRRAGIAPHECRWHAYGERPIGARTALSRPRVLFVGEAAGIDPLFGEGIGQAMRMALVAADSIESGFRRDSLSFRDYPVRLAASPVGRELALLTALARLLYGPQHAALVALAFRRPDATRAYVDLFAGKRSGPSTWLAAARAFPELLPIALRGR